MDEVATWEDWREYFDLVSWLVPDIYRHAPAHVIGIALLSVVGVAARAGALGSMLLYVNARVSGDPLVFLGQTFPTEATFSVFLLWGGMAMGFAALAIIVSYRADVIIFDVAQSYMEMVVRRVLHYKAAGRKIELPDDFENIHPRPIALMLRGNTYRLVRVVIQTLSILLPLITLVAATVALFLTNWLLTVSLVPIIGVYLFGLGLLNRGVMRDSQKRELSRQKLTRDVNAMLGSLTGTRYPPDYEPEWVRSYPRHSWMKDAMSAFRGIILARSRVDYLADAFQGTALLLVLMVFGTLVVSQGTSWAVLLTYLLCLAYATRSMGRASKCVTIANRFIPQVRCYVHFMQNYAPVTRHQLPDEERSSSFKFEANSPRLAGSLPSIEVRSGQVYTCIPAERLKSNGLSELCFALANGDPSKASALEAQMFFLRGIAPLPERALWRYLSENEEQPERILSRVRHLFDRLGVLGEFDQRLGNLDTVLTSEIDNQLSPMLRYTLRLLPGVMAKAPLFVLEKDALENLGVEGRNRILGTLTDQVVLLVPRKPIEVGTDMTHGVLVLDREAVRGIGDADWYLGLDRRAEAEASPPLDLQCSDSDEADDLDDI